MILRSLITSKLRVVPYITPYLLALIAPCETMAIFACRKSWTTNMTVLLEQRLYWVVLFCKSYFWCPLYAGHDPSRQCAHRAEVCLPGSLVTGAWPFSPLNPPIGGFFRSNLDITFYCGYAQISCSLRSASQSSYHCLLQKACPRRPSFEMRPEWRSRKWMPISEQKWTL